MIPPEYVGRYAIAKGASIERGRLLLLVLEGGRAFLVRARGALERGDYPEFVADVSRTQDAILELVQGLGDARGGEIAGHLERLRALLVGHLALANAERSLECVDEALRAYAPIVDAYREVLQRTEAPA